MPTRPDLEHAGVECLEIEDVVRLQCSSGFRGGCSLPVGGTGAAQRRLEAGAQRRRHLSRCPPNVFRGAAERVPLETCGILDCRLTGEPGRTPLLPRRETGPHRSIELPPRKPATNPPGNRRGNPSEHPAGSRNSMDGGMWRPGFPASQIGDGGVHRCEATGRPQHRGTVPVLREDHQREPAVGGDPGEFDWKLRTVPVPGPGQHHGAVTVGRLPDQ